MEAMKDIASVGMSFSAEATRATVLAASGMVATYVAAWAALRWLEGVNERVQAAARDRSIVDGTELFGVLFSREVLLSTTVTAIKRPLEILLPLGSAVQALRILYAYIDWQVHTAKVQLPSSLESAAHAVLHALGALDSAASRVMHVALVALAGWAMLRFKDRLMQFAVDDDDKRVDKQRMVLRALLPISGLITWVLIGGVALTILRQFGIDIQPLLTVGGFSGVVLGFAAQGPLTNLLSGLQLYLSRPFVVGDRVELKTPGGGTLITGFVESIEPLRTCITSDTYYPVSIPNKIVTDTLVTVLSKPAASTFANTRIGRQVTATLNVRYHDMDKMPGIVAELNTWLKNHPGVDRNKPYYAVWSDMSHYNLAISVLCHTNRLWSLQASRLKQELFLEANRLIRKAGADFAVPTHMVEVVERGNGGHANGVSDAVKAAGAGPGLGGR